MNIAIGLVALAFAIAAYGRPVNQEAAKQAFDKADANKDGHISLQEFTPVLQAGNSKITDPKDIAKWFRDADINDNGELNPEEVRLVILFHDIDVDTSNDNFVSLDELKAGADKIDDKISGKIDALFAAFDFNHDEKLNFEEFRLLVLFVNYDENNDGSITWDELKKVLKTLEIELPTKQFAVLFKDADVNEDGKLNEKEFSRLCLFIFYDDDQSGAISFAEAKRVIIENLGDPMTDDHLKTYFQDADINFDNEINFEEFQLLLVFRLHDKDHNYIVTFNELDAALDGFFGKDIDTKKLLGDAVITDNSAFTYEEFRLLALFQINDDDNSNRISYSELRRAFKNGVDTKHDLGKLFKQADINDDGELNFEELRAMAIFHVYDDDHDSTISLYDLQRILQNIGEERKLDAVKANVTALFKQADINDDGELNFEEYRLLLLFRIYDTDDDNNISQAEFGLALKAMGVLAAGEDPVALFKAADINNDKAEKLLNFEEFRLAVLFQIYDDDNSHTISLNELKRALKAIDVLSPKENVAVLFREADINDDGALNFEEFRLLVLFQIYDDDNDNSITLNEFKRTLIAIGEKLTDAQIVDYFKNADINDNGELNFEEFRLLILFLIYDIDNDLKITETELGNALKAIGVLSTGESVPDIFKAADINNDGKEKTLNFEEFRLVVVFQIYDDDNSQKISLSELKRALIAIDVLSPKEIVAEMFKDADISDDGALNFEEFRLLVLFQIYDDDNDNSITLNEFKRTLIAIGETLTDEQIAAHFKTADINDNAELNFEEFRLLVLFFIYDVDNNLFITAVELKAALTAIDVLSATEKEEKEFAKFFKDADINDDGKLNFAEFQLVVLFQIYDDDNSNAITLDELKRALKAIEVLSPKENVATLFREADINESDTLNLEQFRLLILFQIYDDDNDDSISLKELERVFKNLFDDKVQKELKTWFKDADINDDGELNFDEFRILILFHIYDDGEHDGFIDVDEFKRVLAFLGDEDGKQFSHAQELFDIADINDDKKLSFEEFRLLVLFIFYDDDHNNAISLSELKRALRNIGDNTVKEEVEKLFKQADVNNNGELSFSEFIVLASFIINDDDHDGQISSEELKRAMKGIRNDAAEVDKMFKEADTNEPRGQLSFTEYQKLSIWKENK